MAATYKDIQRLTGLSLSTISKYFSGGSVRERNRAAIEAAAQELGFRRNDIARSLKSRRSNTVGILIPELSSTFHTTLISHVSGFLRQQGYSMLVCDCREGEEQEALELLLGKRVDGVIAIPLPGWGWHLKKVAEQGVPVVLLDREPESGPFYCVRLDNEQAAARGVEELAAKGHKALGLLCGPKEIYTMQARRQGFTEAAERYESLVEPAWMEPVEMSVNGGYLGAKRLLEGVRRPTGLLCANYEITLGALMAVNEMGVRIPDELSLIGFDNLELARIFQPSLTILVQPMEELAGRATALLLSLMEGEQVPPRTVALPARLWKGRSVGQAPR